MCAKDERSEGGDVQLAELPSSKFSQKSGKKHVQFTPGRLVREVRFFGSKDSSINLDSVLNELGHFGRYQLCVFVYIILSTISCALHRSQYIFCAGAVNYRCRVPECEGTDATFAPGAWGAWALPDGGGRCERRVPLDGLCSATSFDPTLTQPCTAWVYESHHTIVSEFDLACQEWKRTLVGTVHNAGVFAALGLTAFVSDAFGRKTAYIVTAMSSGFVGIARSFVNNYSVYLVLEFLDATVGAGVYGTGFVLALELVNLKWRVLGGNIISSTFALGQMLTALLAWAFPYWRTLSLILYAPVLLYFLYYFFVEESVRWLLSKGYKKEAARIIFKAAAINRKKLSPASIKMLTEEPKSVKRSSLQKEQSDDSEMPSVFRQVIKSKTLTSRMFIVSFWWITITFIYYGLSINSVSLAGNMYVNFILTSLVEIPGYFLSFLTLDRFGRKSSIITAFLICGIALLALSFIPIVWVVNVLSMLGKLAISMTFTSIYIYTIELFPTYARHSCMNTCSMIGRVGSMCAPQTPLLMQYMEALPYLMFGIMAAISGLLMLLTPETLRIRLPDTVAQAENIVAPRSHKTTDIIVD